MRKIWLIALFLGFALPLMAADSQWEVVVPTPEGNFMVDVKSIQRQGDLLRFKSLRDYKTPQSTYDGKAYLSTLAVIEMDCRAQEAIVLEITYFTGRMLGGEVAFRESDFHLRQPIGAQSPIRRYALRLCR